MKTFLFVCGFINLAVAILWEQTWLGVVVCCCCLTVASALTFRDMIRNSEEDPNDQAEAEQFLSNLTSHEKK